MTSPFEQENLLLEAENLRLTQEIARQAGQIRALQEDPGHLHSRLLLPDDTEPSLSHVIHGSPEALEQVRRAIQARGRLTFWESALAGITVHCGSGPSETARRPS